METATVVGGHGGGDNPHPLHSHSVASSVTIYAKTTVYCYPGSSMRHPGSQWEERDGQRATLTTTYSS
jgi:hypothetical protein